MNGRQHAGSGGPNEASKLWSMPWHARLKTLADTLSSEPNQTLAVRKIARLQIVSVQGSWLGRARSRSLAVQLPSS